MAFRIQGWKIRQMPPEDVRRCVIIGAPHTSNMDFIYGMAAREALGLTHMRFTIKKEWMRFPLNLVFGPLGAISIDRSTKRDGDERVKMVDEMANIINDHEDISVLVTPEGTRKAVKQWKTGFYHVAVKAQVPILLAYLDYKKREAGVGKVIYPSGDFDKDMREIWNFYNTVTPRHPDKFHQL